jgi:beta-lactamase class A
MKSTIAIFLFLTFISLPVFSQTDQLRESVNKLTQSYDAEIGVAISGIEDKDTLSVNGNKEFVMFSVVKFYTALAVLDQVDKGKISLDQKILISRADLIPDTYSPMRDKQPEGNFEKSVAELMSYMVSESDNIAYEKLVSLLNGIESVNKYIQQLGVKNTAIVSTYKDGFEMTLKNKTTPLDATTLLKQSFHKKLLSGKSKDFLWKIMEETVTCPDRLKGLLPESTPVAHKTGSSGIGKNGITIACNDIGIITLPNGKHFAISVLINNSKEKDEVNAKIIAEIARLAWDYFTAKKK